MYVPVIIRFFLFQSVALFFFNRNIDPGCLPQVACVSDSFDGPVQCSYISVSGEMHIEYCLEFE